MNYNLGKYNLGKYNLGSSSGEEIYIEMDCKEFLMADVSSGLNTPFEVTCNSSLNAKAYVTAGVPFEFSLENKISSKAKARISLLIKTDCSENLEAKAYLSENISLKNEYKDELIGKAYVSLDKKFNADYKEDLNFEVYLGKNIYSPSAMLAENLFLLGNSSLINVGVLKIASRLEPGQSVEIDSSIFTAYCGDENVLDLLVGDWIFIDRDTLEINLGSSSGQGLEGIIIFKEAYL